jgi:hypothetical protein
MPRKIDPILAVLRYFEAADLPLAEQALVLAREIVTHRRPSQPPTKAKKKKPSAQPSAGSPPASGPPATVAPPPPGNRPIPPKKPPIRPEEDRPLPGLVTQVGG